MAENKGLDAFVGCRIPDSGVADATERFLTPKRRKCARVRPVLALVAQGSDARPSVGGEIRDLRTLLRYAGALRTKSCGTKSVGTKFPNKWWKLRKDGPVRTIMAHIGKDSYSHIHYEDEQARTISVREAARLHSFPDGFVFEGTMNPAFRQIGNAVPPLMSKALAVTLYQALYVGVSKAMAVVSPRVV